MNGQGYVFLSFLRTFQAQEVLLSVCLNLGKLYVLPFLVSDRSYMLQV